MLTANDFYLGFKEFSVCIAHACSLNRTEVHGNRSSQENQNEQEDVHIHRDGFHQPQIGSESELGLFLCTRSDWLPTK